MRTQSLLGRISEATYEPVFGAAYVCLRILMGGLFLSAGWAKVAGDWSAQSYLLTAQGPFSEGFRALAGNGVVDGMNAWGLFLLGIALMFGLCVRPAALGGVILMLLYYLAHFVENTAHGYIDEHGIYAMVLLLFAAGGAGHVFGLNTLILGNIRKPSRLVRWWLG